MAKLERASSMLERQVEALKEQQDLLLPESDRLRDDIESLEAEVEKLSAERLVANSRIEHLETALRDSEIEKERNLRVLQDMMTEQAELAEGKDFRIKSLEKQVQELNNKHQVFAAMEQKRDTVEVTPKSVNSELEEAKLLNTQLWALVELQMKEYEKASWEAQGTANRTEKKKEQADFVNHIGSILRELEALRAHIEILEQDEPRDYFCDPDAKLAIGTATQRGVRRKRGSVASIGAPIATTSSIFVVSPGRWVLALVFGLGLASTFTAAHVGLWRRHRTARFRFAYVAIRRCYSCSASRLAHFLCAGL